MRYMSSKEIRETWLKFFENKGHEILKGASLIPINDPTLLWINAGVAPLKKYFDGSEKPSSNRLTNVQKCIRTNDIENVGLTSRHHTFFEMLGNFSIGDYFKEEAIEFGYEILTSKDYFDFPLEKLYFTYYTNDLVAKNKWLSLGIKESHLIPMDDNYWEIGEGPSGPNTEIFYDRGESYDKRGVELIKDDLENDRYIEIWNIVFSQYNAKEGLKRSEYPELPNKNIDTGAGLERFASILQNTKSNFETDLFMPIINKIEEISNVKYDESSAFKVIADHIKTLVFSISDGAMLSNEGRGYVLRRILRRALNFGRKLNLNEPFLYKLIPSVIETMESFYPELNDNVEIVTKIIKREEELFLETLEHGIKHFYDSIKDSNALSGKEAFKLYDTYGFPIELTLEYAEEENINVDLEGFKYELEEQKKRSRSARKDEGSMKEQDDLYLNFKDESLFVGYDTFETTSKVIKVFESGIILDKTPFYATSGGQIADKGTINDIEVLDVYKLPNGQHLHVIDGLIEEGSNALAKINLDYRNNITLNHTATHILHQALKDILGTHVNQQGSLVTDKYLRFDFNHYDKLTDELILEVEKIVKNKINESLNVVIKEMNIEDAKKLGAMALFGEKYGDKVRVVNMGYSIELCGGCHVSNTKDIKDFSIISYESVGSGTYRVIASTNGHILELFENELTHLNNDLKQTNLKLEELNEENNYEINIINSYDTMINANILVKNVKELLHNKQKELELEKAKDILTNADSLIPNNYSKKEIIVVNNIDSKVLKQLSDVLFDKMHSESLLLINKTDSNATLILKTNGNTNAGKTLKEILSLLEGRGGGNNTIAQGGTTNLDLLNNKLVEIKDML